MKYKVSMSNKNDVYINKEDYKKLLENMNNSFVLLGDELINPSFIISITRQIDIEGDVPKSLDEIKTEEIIALQMKDCKICNGKGWLEKRQNDGTYVASPCICQKVKNPELKKITNNLVNKFQI